VASRIDRSAGRGSAQAGEVRELRGRANRGLAPFAVGSGKLGFEVRFTEQGRIVVDIANRGLLMEVTLSDRYDTCFYVQ